MTEITRFHSDNLFVSSAAIWHVALRWALIDVSISSFFRVEMCLQGVTVTNPQVRLWPGAIVIHISA